MKNKQQSDNIIIEVDKKYASQFAEWLHLHNVHVIEVKIKLKSPSQVIIKNNSKEINQLLYKLYLKRYSLNA